MKNCVPELTLDDVLRIGLNCVELGIEDKNDVREEILNYVEKNYVDLNSIQRAEELPIDLLELLHRQLGVTFEAIAGKLTRAYITPLPATTACITVRLDPAQAAKEDFYPNWRSKLWRENA